MDIFLEIEQYSKYFATEPNKAYFWHGRTTKGKKYEAKAMAEKMAKRKRGKTIEMCMFDNRTELEKLGFIEFYERKNKNGKVIYRQVITHTKIALEKLDIPEFDAKIDDYVRTKIENNPLYKNNIAIKEKHIEKLRKETYAMIDDELYKMIWDRFSKCFANEASGYVYVVEGTDERVDEEGIEHNENDYPYSVWNRVEQPILIKSIKKGKVNKIRRLNAVDGKEIPENED